MKLNGQQIFEYMANLPDELILESLPPVVGTGRFGRSARSESRVKAFFQSGWFAAVLCAVVSLGVVGAVIWAGREGGDKLPPIAGTEETTVYADPEEPLTGETESFFEKEIVKVEKEAETTIDGYDRTKVTISTVDCLQKPIEIVFYITPYSTEDEGGIGANEGLGEYQYSVDIFYAPSISIEYDPPFERWENRFLSEEDALDYIGWRILPAVVHSGYQVLENGISATCTVGGMRSGVRCSACGEAFHGCEPTPPTGHHVIKGEQCVMCDLTVSKNLRYIPYGKGGCFVAGFEEDASDKTKAVIPQYAPTGEIVVGICEDAFKGCTDLSLVILPRYFFYIEKNAFVDCPNLSVIYSPMTAADWSDNVRRADPWHDKDLRMKFADVMGGYRLPNGQRPS
ncbi:MAG: hypothetical protein IJW90_02635 [Clostridia bacterium]|nr:hypothetical protein [Clostridia bacterium]